MAILRRRDAEILQLREKLREISILTQLNLSDNIINRNNLYPPVTKMLLPQVLLIVLLLSRMLRIILIQSRLMISNVSIPP